MEYNKNKILKMLVNAPLYEGMDFHEGMNDEFLNAIAMDFDFYNNYSYAHGATKLALIPINKNEKYVIKIPYTGSYDHESGYYYNSIYINSKTDYWDYTAADNHTSCWDYCATEVERYETAKNAGFARFFAKTEFLDYINNYPIYIQEKCITLSNSSGSHHHSKEERETTLNICKNYFNINKDWLTDFRLCYGTNTLLNFLNFIQDMEWDDDLRNENIGYIDNHPVLIDYSGFLE